MAHNASHFLNTKINDIGQHAMLPLGRRKSFPLSIIQGGDKVDSGVCNTECQLHRMLPLCYCTVASALLKAETWRSRNSGVTCSLVPA